MKLLIVLFSIYAATILPSTAGQTHNPAHILKIIYMEHQAEQEQEIACDSFHLNEYQNSLTYYDTDGLFHYIANVVHIDELRVPQ